MPNLKKFVTDLLGFDENHNTNSTRQEVRDMKVNDPIINEEFMKEVRGKFCTRFCVYFLNRFCQIGVDG